MIGSIAKSVSGLILRLATAAEPSRRWPSRQSSIEIQVTCHQAVEKIPRANFRSFLAGHEQRNCYHIENWSAREKQGHRVNQTTRYLQSVSDQQGIEIGALVNYLLIDAIKLCASDIHIEPWDTT